LSFVSVFGIEVYCGRRKDFLKNIDNLLKNHLPIWIITLNTLMVEEALKNPFFMSILKANKFASHVVKFNVIDSSGIQLYILFKKLFIPERIPGIELIYDFLKIGLKRNLKFFFLGAKEEINKKAVEYLKKKFEGITISGRNHGYFKNDEEIIEKINNSETDVLFVGFDVPRQEIWIHKNLKKLKVKLVMGVGGSFDVISGRLPRAPYFLRIIGFEWFFRFLIQPWRIKRIKKLPVFFLRIFIEFLKR